MAREIKERMGSTMLSQKQMSAANQYLHPLQVLAGEIFKSEIHRGDSTSLISEGL